MRIQIPQLQLDFADCPAHANLLAFLSQNQVPVARSCGGDGVCGTCRVRISGPDLPAASDAELRLAKRQGCKPGERFACLIKVPDSSKTWVLHCDYW